MRFPSPGGAAGSELACEILHTFIQRVEVGEQAKRYDRNAPQEIRIYYRDIGLICASPVGERSSLRFIQTDRSTSDNPSHR